MIDLKYILFALLNILPWVYFLFLPFHKTTIFGYRQTFGIVSTVLILFDIAIAVIFLINMVYVVASVLFQIVSLIIALIMALLLIDDDIYKILFAFFVIIPGSLLTVVISDFFGLYCYNSVIAIIIIRIIATFIVSFLFIYFFKKYFVEPPPYVQDKEKELWKHAWIIPALLALLCLSIYCIEIILEKVNVLDVILQIIIFLSTIAICILLFNCLGYARKEIIRRTETEKLNILLELQKKNHQKVLVHFERIKKNNHDFRHHLMTINTYASNQENEKLHHYIKDLVNVTNEYQHHFFCENMTINAILVSNYKKAKDNNINISFKLAIPEDLNISDVDLSILIGNLIENAIEASLFLPEDQRNITVKGKLFADKLYIIFENNYIKTQNQKNEKFLSSKRNFESEGVGLYTVRTIVEKYNGEMEIVHDGKIFTTKIVLDIS